VVVGLLSITDRWTFGWSSLARARLALAFKLPIQDRLGKSSRGFMTFYSRAQVSRDNQLAEVKWRRLKLKEVRKILETSLLFTCA